jgi:hypothetical protein
LHDEPFPLLQPTALGGVHANRAQTDDDADRREARQQHDG